MDKLSLWKDKVEQKLRDLFKAKYPGYLAEATGYYLFQPGKRIRPLITVAVTDALGGNEEDAITAGCVIEMVHNYSLIHDDLPAMDNDDYRRGLPTCHKKFGEAIAILAGDALLTYAFEVLSRDGVFKSLPADRVLSLIHLIAVKSGIEGMVGGQALDIKGEANHEEICFKKTSALFEACFISGGIVAGREDLSPALEKLGRSFGLLFQITDDILDRDGFYKLLGEETAIRKAKEVYGECLELLRETFRSEPPAVKLLLNKVFLRVGTEG